MLELDDLKSIRLYLSSPLVSESKLLAIPTAWHRNHSSTLTLGLSIVLSEKKYAHFSTEYYPSLL